MKKATKAALFWALFSCSLIAADDVRGHKKEDDMTQLALTSHMKPMDRMEIAFVLLPDEFISQTVSDVAVKVEKKITTLEQLPPNPVWGNDFNAVVRIPHVSIGQYGFLAMEYETLKEIIIQTAQKFKSLEEPMAHYLSVTKENIFLDFQHIKEKTSPLIIDMYVELRDQFMTRMATKFPIAQALLQRLENKNNPDELILIEQF